MKIQPLISIIIPVYNVENYLRQCLDSVLNQTYANLDIIVVNDGSKDNSLKILEEYVALDSRVSLINQDNSGVSHSRNEGILLAKGSHIMFVDSDDWLDLTLCEDLLNYLENKDYDLLFWPYIREYENKSIPKDIFDASKEYKSNQIEELHLKLFGLTGKQLAKPENADALVTVHMKLFKKDIIVSNKLQFVDLKLIGTAEDALFNASYFNYISSAFYINKHYYHYRRDNLQSITSVYKPNLVAKWMTLFQMMDDLIVTYKLSPKFKTALQNRISLGIIGLGLNELSSKDSLPKKYTNIAQILDNPTYKNAIKNLPLKYFPKHWKLFLFCAKYNIKIGVFLLLKAINTMVNRHK